MKPVSIVAAALVGLMLAGAAWPSFGQAPQVQRDFYQGLRRNDAGRVTFCLWEGNPLTGFERTLGGELAAALLLKPEFYVVPRQPVRMDSAFQEALFIALEDHCDVSLGYNIVPGLLPDWLIATQPYYDAPFLLVTKDQGAASLADLPYGAAIGSMVFTTADRTLVTLINALPEARRWQRLPYGDTAAMIADLETGKIAAALTYGPALKQVVGDLGAKGLRSIATAPLPLDPLPVGAVLRSNNTFLREALDEAIASLRADGTMARLLEESAMPPDPNL